MAMDFWEAQRRARLKTALYLIVFIALTCLVAIAAEIAMRMLAGEGYVPPLPYVGLAFLAITFSVTGFHYIMYRTLGGAYVANSVGAYLIAKDSADFKEKQLLNIVEEMAVAASIPVPQVYILEAGEINAFAAGMRPDNAVIAITRGALEKLERDEVQGVVAHEMGHIHNGDMLLSMRLAAMVMGFFVVLYLGLRAMQFAGYSGSGRSKEGRNNGNVMMVAAFILLVAGSIMWFFGSVMKSMVSREREYLADASSVQFTRNSKGIAHALRKIAKETGSDMPKSGIAYSHMYLEDKSSFSSIFATHPPIAKRIAAIEDSTPS